MRVREITWEFVKIAKFALKRDRLQTARTVFSEARFSEDEPRGTNSGRIRTHLEELSPVLYEIKEPWSVSRFVPSSSRQRYACAAVPVTNKSHVFSAKGSRGFQRPLLNYVRSHTAVTLCVIAFRAVPKNNVVPGFLKYKYLELRNMGMPIFEAYSN